MTGEGVAGTGVDDGRRPVADAVGVGIEDGRVAGVDDETRATGDGVGVAVGEQPASSVAMTRIVTADCRMVAPNGAASAGLSPFDAAGTGVLRAPIGRQRDGLSSCDRRLAGPLTSAR